MKLIIDISEEDYKKLEYEYYGEDEINHVLLNNVLVSLMHGKPLTEDTDLISRKAVLEIIEREEFKGDALSEIEKLPSVKPQEPKIVPIAEIKFAKDELKELVDKAVLTVTPQEPKTGHWIMLGTTEEIYCEEAKCSICGSVEVNAGYDKYCPNCGAKMEINVDKAIWELYEKIPHLLCEQPYGKNGRYITYYAEERLYLVFDLWYHGFFLVEADSPKDAIEKVNCDKLKYVPKEKE